MIALRFLIVIVTCMTLGCETTYRKIIIDGMEENHQLSIKMEYEKAELGIAFFKTFLVKYSSVEAIYRIVLKNQYGYITWSLKCNDKKNAVGFVRYAEVPKNYEQIFPLNNSSPVDLEYGSKLIMLIEAETGTYEKTFIYQPGLIYIMDEDKK